MFAPTGLQRGRAPLQPLTQIALTKWVVNRTEPLTLKLKSRKWVPLVACPLTEVDNGPRWCHQCPGWTTAARLNSWRNTWHFVSSEKPEQHFPVWSWLLSWLNSRPADKWRAPNFRQYHYVWHHDNKNDPVLKQQCPDTEDTVSFTYLLKTDYLAFYHHRAFTICTQQSGTQCNAMVLAVFSQPKMVRARSAGRYQGADQSGRWSDAMAAWAEPSGWTASSWLIAAYIARQWMRQRASRM